MNDEIKIVFSDPNQLKAFVLWFKKKGFESFTKSQTDKINPVTCMATDEKMDWGHFFELE